MGLIVFRESLNFIKSSIYEKALKGNRKEQIQCFGKGNYSLEYDKSMGRNYSLRRTF